MTIKYIKKVAPYYLGLSLLFTGSVFAEIALGDTGIKWSGGGRVENTTQFAASENFGKKSGGRYVTNMQMIRFDAIFTGSHAIKGMGNAIWEMGSRVYTNDKLGSTDIPRTGFIGLESTLGTMIIGKFYTPTDDIVYLNALNGDLFGGYDVGNAMFSNNNYVAKYNAAIQYSLPKTLVEGLEMNVLVAVDPNANQEGAMDKTYTAKYPFGFDTSVKYTMADTGLFAAVAYAENHNLSKEGEALTSTSTIKELEKSINRSVVTKVGYSKDNIAVTAGYRNIYHLVKQTLKDNSFVNNTTYSYALSLDASYKLDKNNFAIGYEITPKASDNKTSMISALYAYSVNTNLTLELQTNHVFKDIKGHDFIKNSATELVTRAKYEF